MHVNTIENESIKILTMSKQGRFLIKNLLRMQHLNSEEKQYTI